MAVDAPRFVLDINTESNVADERYPASWFARFAGAIARLHVGRSPPAAFDRDRFVPPRSPPVPRAIAVIPAASARFLPIVRFRQLTCRTRSRRPPKGKR